MQPRKQKYRKLHASVKARKQKYRKLSINFCVKINPTNNGQINDPNEAFGAGKCQQKAGVSRGSGRAPSPRAREMPTLRSRWQKRSCFAMPFHRIATTPERNTQFATPNGPKSTPFRPQMAPNGTKAPGSIVFYDRLSMSPSPLRNGIPTLVSKNAFGARVVSTFLKNDTTLQPNTRFFYS